MEQIAMAAPSAPFVVGILAAAYVVIVLVSRRFLVATPARAHFEQRHASLMALVSNVDGSDTSGQTHVARAEVLLKAAGRFLQRRENHTTTTTVSAATSASAATLGRWKRFIDRWTRPLGRLTAGWRLLHDAERELARAWRADRVTAEMAARGLDDALLLKAVAGRAVTSTDAITDPVRRELLVASMEATHEARDTEYAAAARTHRRALHLMVVLAALLPLLAWMAMKPAALLLGAVGGVLSRALRIAKSETPVATGYGLHWSAIFLAPVVGGAAAGMGLVMLAGSAALGVTGETLRPVCVDFGWTAAECRAETTPTSATNAPTTAVTATTGAPSTTSASTAGTVEDAAEAIRLSRPSLAEPGKSGAATTTTSTSVPSAGSPRRWNGGLPLALSPIAAMLAFAFGFSERFFNKWIERVTESFDPANSRSAGTTSTATLTMLTSTKDEGDRAPEADQGKTTGGETKTPDAQAGSATEHAVGQASIQTSTTPPAGVVGDDA